MQQPQYYKTVPIGEKPKQPDLYHTLIEHEKLGIEGLPCHNNYIGDPNGGYWEIDGESKVTHYLEPIPIPDADRLREALEKIVATLEPAIRIELSHHDMMVSIHNIAREALSQTGDGWVRVENGLPEPRIRVIVTFDVGGYDIGHVNHDDKTWRDDDDNTFNPAFPATHWRPLPSPPQPINP